MSFDQCKRLIRIITDAFVLFRSINEANETSVSTKSVQKATTQDYSIATSVLSALYPLLIQHRNSIETKNSETIQKNIVTPEALPSTSVPSASTKPPSKTVFEDEDVASSGSISVSSSSNMKLILNLEQKYAAVTPNQTQSRKSVYLTMPKAQTIEISDTSSFATRGPRPHENGDESVIITTDQRLSTGYSENLDNNDIDGTPHVNQDITDVDSTYNANEAQDQSQYGEPMINFVDDAAEDQVEVSVPGDVDDSDDSGDSDDDYDDVVGAGYGEENIDDGNDDAGHVHIRDSIVNAIGGALDDGDSISNFRAFNNSHIFNDGAGSARGHLEEEDTYQGHKYNLNFLLIILYR